MVSYDGVIMLSGGIDSALLTHRAGKADRKVKLLHFDFGRSASDAELAAVKRLANDSGLQLEVVDLQGLQGMMAGALTPEDRLEGEWDTKCPYDASVLGAVTALGLYYAQIHEIPEVELGLTKEQIDARPGVSEFAAAMGAAISAYNPHVGGVTLKLPLAEKSKADIIREAADVGVELAMAWSCVKPGMRQCGVCPACTDRRKAFQDAGVSDPTQYGAEA